MWYALQLVIFFSVGCWLISLGETNGRAIGIAGFLAALAVTLTINGLVLSMVKFRDFAARLRARRQQRVSASYAREQQTPDF